MTHQSVDRIGCNLKNLKQQTTTKYSIEYKIYNAYYASYCIKGLKKLGLANFGSDGRAYCVCGTHCVCVLNFEIQIYLLF